MTLNNRQRPPSSARPVSTLQHIDALRVELRRFLTRARKMGIDFDHLGPSGMGAAVSQAFALDHALEQLPSTAGDLADVVDVERARS